MLRVNSSNVLVVPPFECAWILDESRQLKDNAGCVTFEAKGDNDATLILKPKPGSKRWQHRESEDLREANQHYTIIFGSHQNSCIKIEKDSLERYRADTAASISANSFAACWVDYNNGEIKLGTGEPGSKPNYSWTDTDPIKDVQHVGLGSWDKHVCFRNIHVHPSLTQHAPSAGATGQEAVQSNVPRLVDLCGRALVAAASPGFVCSALALVEMLGPALDGVASSLIGYLARHLEEAMCADSEGFQALSAPLLSELLGNPCLECQERRVFDAVILWAYGTTLPADQQQIQQSLADVEALLHLIRFPLMSQQDLENLRSHALIEKSSVLAHLLSEAAQARMHQAAAADDKNPSAELVVEGKRLVKSVGQCSPIAPGKFKRRHAPASHDLMFVTPGDSNGVTYWLGTCYGTQKWVNPALSGMIEVQASSPCCKHTDPKSVVGRNFLRLNLAGQGITGAWWLIDLGPRHRLICNYYTLRHDASIDFPRSWILQGSTDGTGWVDLRQHENDCSLCLAQQCFSWPVVGHAASMPYRLFRILLRGPNASPAGNRHCFHLSMLELYGHFFRLR